MMMFGRCMGAIDPNLITAIITAGGQTVTAVATGVAAGKQVETEMIRAKRKKSAIQTPQVVYAPPVTTATQTSSVPWVPILLAGSALGVLYLATRRAKPRQSV